MLPGMCATAYSLSGRASNTTALPLARIAFISLVETSGVARPGSSKIASRTFGLALAAGAAATAAGEHAKIAVSTDRRIGVRVIERMQHRVGMALFFHLGSDDA